MTSARMPAATRQHTTSVRHALADAHGGSANWIAGANEPIVKRSEAPGGETAPITMPPPHLYAAARDPLGRDTKKKPPGGHRRRCQ